MTYPSEWRLGPLAIPKTVVRPFSGRLRLATQATATPSAAQGSFARAVLVLLVALPIAFNAFALLPEIRVPVPSLNDDAFHYLFVQRASQALADGRNPFDVWSPALELGFPQSLDYQTTPHLFVVLLNRLLLGQAGLLTLFNLTRYLLMVGFPLTVFWSMRRMGFSTVAAAIGAGASSLLSSDGRYGFDYESYVWRGFGMYTQLWAMHLTFIVMGCLDVLLQRGRGYLAAIAACTLLVLCHLLYTEMMVVTVAVLFLTGLTRNNARARLLRLGVVGALTLFISSYFWLPFLRNLPYLNASIYLQSWKYDSFGPRTILGWLVSGMLLDANRLPVLTAVLAIGIVAAALTRTRQARLALALFAVWLLLYFGRQPWGMVTDHLPAHDLLWFHRLIGGVHLASILLIGLGGEFMWQQATMVRGLPIRGRAILAAAIPAVFLLVAIGGLWSFYELNGQWMARTLAAIDGDSDAHTMLSALDELPPGRTFAGLRTDWGQQMREGDLHFADLLTFHDIPAVSPPYNSLSLNSDLMWHFDYRNRAHYQLFNVRYVIAPAGIEMPEFLRPIKTAPRYTLYQVDTSGYAQFVAIAGTEGVESKSSLFYLNRTWFLNSAPADQTFIRWDYPAADSPLGGAAAASCPGSGSLKYERVLSEQLDFLVECSQPAPLAIKVTYHPNWEITIDGRRRPAFMLSPSLIGVSVPAGLHHVEATYVPPLYPTMLMLLGAATLFGVALLRHRIKRLDSHF